jgi:hypothetical protein
MENRKQPVTVSKAELAFLNAIIEFTREAEGGKTENVIIHIEPQYAAVWAKALVKAGKWAWANRWKLYAAAEAVWDLIGGSVFAERLPDDQQALDTVRREAGRDLRLGHLVQTRDRILQEMERQNKHR